MMMKNIANLIVCLSLLGGCQALAEQDNPEVPDWEPGAREAFQVFTGEHWVRLDTRPGRAGLQVLDRQGRTLSRLSGGFEELQSARAAEQDYVITLDRDRNSPVVFGLSDAGDLKRLGTLPVDGQPVDRFCLQIHQGMLFSWVIDGEGQAVQWLLTDTGQSDFSPRRVRSISMPPEAEGCLVTPLDELLVLESERAIWRYGAGPEAPFQRDALDIAAPFGEHLEEPVAMAALPGGLAVLDHGEQTALHLYRFDGQWRHQKRLAWPQAAQAETLWTRSLDERIQLWAFDEQAGDFIYRTLEWSAAFGDMRELPVVKTTVETESMAVFGDVADDPAIWVHPKRPADSRIIGTDKRQGALHVYDLSGKRVQHLPSGRLNNVDWRGGLEMGQRTIDVAAASNRTDHSVTLFAIDRDSGQLTEAGSIATDMPEIYGLCMYRHQDGGMYVFANDKSGRFVQYRVEAKGETLSGQAVREFRVASQPEGCVADDKAARLFVGEEAEGVWLFDAAPGAGDEREAVIMTGGDVTADVEGLALYQTPARDLLVISSQGSDSYVIVEAEAPWPVLAHFRIGMNAGQGLDGASETDGLAVTSQDLGGDFSEGMLVVQDGRNVMPLEPQNFKYVAWGDIAELLEQGEASDE
jgi:3-phytase